MAHWRSMHLGSCNQTSIHKMQDSIAHDCGNSAKYSLSLKYETLESYLPHCRASAWFLKVQPQALKTRLRSTSRFLHEVSDGPALWRSRVSISSRRDRRMNGMDTYCSLTGEGAAESLLLSSLAIILRSNMMLSQGCVMLASSLFC